MPEHSRLLLVFSLEDQRYALPLGAVVRVLPMMETVPLPGAPNVVKGIIDVAGRIVPVMDLRRRFGLPAREARLSDTLIIARTRERLVALAADGVIGLIERLDDEVTPAHTITRGLTLVDGVVIDHGLVLIHDVDRFLSSAEQERLTRALAAQTEHSS